MTAAGARFIAFEGGEGAGKTTQIQFLSDYLAARGDDVVVTREPGGTPEGQELRRLLLTDAGAPWSVMSEMLLMVADRAQHLERVIRPAIAAGRVVVTDRYVYSTLAYQGAGRGISEAVIRDLHRLACDDLWPDLTILLDIDPRIGLTRSKRRLAASGNAERRFEDLDLSFHDRVRAAFLQMAALAPAAHPVVVVDAGGDPDAVRQEIRRRVETAS